MAFDWYKSVEPSAPIEQGDLIKNCTVIIPPKKLEVGAKYDVSVKKYDVIILTQSCDIENGKVEMLLVCPYKTLLETLKTYRGYKELTTDDERKAYLQDQANKLANGDNLGYHILDKNPDMGLPEHLVINLRRTFSININYAKDLVASNQSRIRLQPPYREALSQAYATLFMRVGLPSPIQSV